MPISLLESLLSELDEIQDLVNSLLDASTINYIRNDPNSVCVWIGPERYWGDLDNNGLSKQAEALKAFDSWYEIVEFLFSDKPGNVRGEVKDLRAFVRRWIDRRGQILGDVPKSIPEAKQTMCSKLNELRKHINWLQSISQQGLILIPDVNSLIKNRDIHNYGKGLDEKEFTIILVPTVLQELDKLKVVHRDEDFRKKVESVINFIKGFRKQGNLLNGVIIHKTVTVKMIASEPKVEETLDWLDKDIADDRIIASSLEIQRQNPGAKAILVTSDINLQNKAEAAKLPYIDTPQKNLSNPS